jgi:hypothetical protein
MRRTKSDIASTRRSKSANVCAKRRSSNTSSTSLKSASSSCARSSPPHSCTSQTRSSQVHCMRHQTRLGPSTTRDRTGTRRRTAMASGASARSWKLRTVSRRATALYSTLRQHAFQNNQRPHRHHQHQHQPQSLLPQSSPRHQCLHQTTPPPPHLPSPSSRAHASSHYPNQPKSSSSTATAKSNHQSPSKSNQQRFNNHHVPSTQTNPSDCVSNSPRASPRQSYHH